MFKKNKQKNLGFTLVETLVAISVLSISILATFTAVQKGLQASALSKDQITAFYLTQEVMELIKNVRDENALHAISGATNPITGQPYTWLSGISENVGDACYFGKTCVVDSPVGIANSGGVTTCSGGFGTCPYIRQDAVTGLFGYNAGWTQTNFKREVQLVQVVSNVEVSVVVNISWTTGGSSRSFQIKESIFNRQ